MSPRLHQLLRIARAILRLSAFAAFWVTTGGIPVVLGSVLGQHLSLAQDWAKLWAGYSFWIVALVIAAAVWIVLFAMRKRWQAPSQGVRFHLLLPQLSLSARYIADAQHLTPKARENKRGELAFHVATSITSGYPKVEDVRAIVYKFNTDYTELRPYRHSGRRKPSGEFTLRDERGKAAIKFALTSEDAQRVGNTKQAPPGWQGKGRSYQTYISVPIVSEGQRYGMLSIDAKHVGSLTPSDEEVASLAAALLGILFASIVGVNKKMSAPESNVDNRGDDDGNESEDPSNLSFLEAATP